MKMIFTGNLVLRMQGSNPLTADFSATFGGDVATDQGDMVFGFSGVSLLNAIGQICHAMRMTESPKKVRITIETE